MSKNKLKKFADMATYQHVFQADFEQLRDNGFALKGNWNSNFFHNNNPIVIELGCGKGEYTIGLARLYPNKNFIGIDIKGARMHTGATQAKEEGLTNVAFIRTRIEFIQSFFAENEVSEIWVTFPDPQMQKERKRLVGTLMLTRYRSLLKSNGCIHLKTDSNFLYKYTIEMFKVNNITPEICLEDLYNSSFTDSILSIQTYYESKWIAHGLTIKYIKFVIPQDISLVEPQVEIEYDTYHSAGRGVKEKVQTKKQ